jgi:tetratricopeptide (TPR) repeat protein
LDGTYDLKKASAQWIEDTKKAKEMEAISGKLRKDMNAKNWDAANSDVDEFAKILSPEQIENLKMTRFQILVGKGDYTPAYAVLREFADAHKDNPAEQNELAWMLVSDKSIEHPDLDLAQTLAQRAVDGAKDDELKSQSLDTLARVKFLKGNKDEAISLEEKAVAMSAGDLKNQLQKTLDSYKKGELTRAD